MTHAQSSAQIQGPTPEDLVNEIWMNATQGDLLAIEGWNRTARFYVRSEALPKKLSFDVVSNYWAVWPAKIRDDTAEVDVGYTALGKIDPLLRYTPAPSTPYMKTAVSYRLRLVSGYNVMYGPDGKTVISKKPSGSRGWQIEGSRGIPWTTVNTAIRYVLEMRKKASDPDVKKNGDRTLAKLLQLH